MNESMKKKWDSLRPMDRKQWIGQVRGEPLPVFFSKWDELTAQEQSVIEGFLLKRFRSARRRSVRSAAKTIDRQPWLAGFVAGEAGRPAHGCQASQDVHSWLSGWAEGNAKRQGHEYSLGALTPADVDEYKADKRNRAPLRPPLLPRE